MKKSITLLLLISSFISYAQSHSTSADDYCKLKGKRGNQLGYCSACYAEDKKIADAKIAKDKRDREKLYEENRIKKEKIEKEREEKRLKDAKEAKSGEVYINMPSSSSSSNSTNSSTSSSSSSTTEEKSTDKKEESSTTYYPPYVPQKTQQEKINELTQSTGDLMNNIAADIEANRIKKEAEQRREAERRAKNEAYGKKLIYENELKAFQGNESAIEKTYMGYMNINKNSTEEGNNKEALKFLEEIHNKFNNSAFAKEQLIKDYSRTINFYDTERHKRTTKTFVHFGIGAGLIAGTLAFADEISSEEMLGEDTGPIASTGLILFGGYMAMSGIFNSLLISEYSKSRTEYKEAKGRIESLNKQNVKISLSTGYNKRTNNMMVGLVIGF